MYYSTESPRGMQTLLSRFLIFFLTMYTTLQYFDFSELSFLFYSRLLLSFYFVLSIGTCKTLLPF